MLFIVIFIIFVIGMLLPFIIACKITEEIKFDKSIRDHLNNNKPFLDIINPENKN